MLRKEVSTARRYPVDLPRNVTAFRNGIEPDKITESVLVPQISGIIHSWTAFVMPSYFVVRKK
jgi:hypothetical protein